MKEDRTIDPKTTDVLTRGLRQLPHNKFWITTQTTGSTGYSEQRNFALQLQNIFVNAGWTKDAHTERNDPSKIEPDVSPALGDTGCGVFISLDSRLAAAQALLIGELAKSYIACKAYPDLGIPPDLISVEIAPHGG
jgi:hypothetical protein